MACGPLFCIQGPACHDSRPVGDILGQEYRGIFNARSKQHLAYFERNASLHLEGPDPTRQERLACFVFWRAGHGLRQLLVTEMIAELSSTPFARASNCAASFADGSPPRSSMCFAWCAMGRAEETCFGTPSIGYSPAKTLKLPMAIQYAYVNPRMGRLSIGRVLPSNITVTLI